MRLCLPSVLLLILFSNYNYIFMIKSLLPVLFILTLLYSAESELVVAVIGSNDIHGKAFPTMLARQDTG